MCSRVTIETSTTGTYSPRRCDTSRDKPIRGSCRLKRRRYVVLASSSMSSHKFVRRRNKYHTLLLVYAFQSTSDTAPRESLISVCMQYTVYVIMLQQRESGKNREYVWHLHVIVQLPAFVWLVGYIIYCSLLYLLIITCAPNVLIKQSPNRSYSRFVCRMKKIKSLHMTLPNIATCHACMQSGNFGMFYLLFSAWAVFCLCDHTKAGEIILLRHRDTN